VVFLLERHQLHRFLAALHRVQHHLTLLKRHHGVIAAMDEQQRNIDGVDAFDGRKGIEQRICATGYAPYGFRAKRLLSPLPLPSGNDTRATSRLMNRRRSTRFLNLYRVYPATFLSALRTAQPLLQIREPRIPSADVCQQIRIGATIMSAPGTLDHQ